MAETRSAADQPAAVPSPGREDRTGWQAFVDAACEATGVDPQLVDIDTVLALAKTVAHSGARPMAPVSAYIAGLAVGSGVGTDSTIVRAQIEDAAQHARRPNDR